MLTAPQLSAKRHERTMTSRSKAKAKARRYGISAQTAARNRERTSDWLMNLGMAQAKSAETLEAARRQALESRRTKAAMSSHPPKGFFGRVKAFFQRRTP